jgi:hypothetical protein
MSRHLIEGTRTMCWPCGGRTGTGGILEKALVSEALTRSRSWSNTGLSVSRVASPCRRSVLEGTDADCEHLQVLRYESPHSPAIPTRIATLVEDIHSQITQSSHVSITLLRMAAGLLYRADRLCIFAMPPIDYHLIGLPSIEVDFPRYSTAFTSFPRNTR